MGSRWGWEHGDMMERERLEWTSKLIRIYGIVRELRLIDGYGFRYLIGIKGFFAII